jgi:hypothetical protein
MGVHRAAGLNQLGPPARVMRKCGINVPRNKPWMPTRHRISKYQLKQKAKRIEAWLAQQPPEKLAANAVFGVEIAKRQIVRTAVGNALAQGLLTPHNKRKITLPKLKCLEVEP